MKKLSDMLQDAGKSDSLKIIAFYVGGFCIFLLFALLLLKFLGLFDSIDGKYYSKEYKELGIDFQLEIDDGEYTLTSNNGKVVSTDEGLIACKDNNVTLYSDSTKKSASGVYDAEAHTITIDNIVFSKE